ncbi:hypothetical protein RRG08_043157 [Elysia crispata]|uniref:Uncharacterized protein n=1 Tax=Elysia crispata TaxID=231223 RepID=A0AAE1ASI4_9GAST|nr:hypothetical protein RRG08_043157 [Elysia crispata]
MGHSLKEKKSNAILESRQKVIPSFKLKVGTYDLRQQQYCKNCDDDSNNGHSSHDGGVYHSATKMAAGWVSVGLASLLLVMVYF